MQDQSLNVPTDAAAATDPASWLAIIDQIGEEEGYFQTVGDRHWALFVDDSPTLLVSFETIESARARPGQMPLAHSLAAAHGWSHLCLIAKDQAWFRHPAVYAYFDRLIDDAFFEDFDRVLFYGAGPSGYAACAYAVCAPGAQVLALNPVATLNPAQTGWDDRFKSDRRLDFSSRFGYAPDMVEGADHVTLIVDPKVRLDAMHAALFHAPYVTTIPARLAGSDLEATLIRLNVLGDLIAQAANSTLTPASFATLWRNRRDDLTYLKSLQQSLVGKAKREIVLCSNVSTRLKIARFRKRLGELNEKKNTTTTV
ncbi:MAG: phosphoadenosine phosphosulfate reductase [Paracoccaceae bacterium]